MLLVLCTVHMHIITLLVPTICMLDVFFVLLQCFEMTHEVISHVVRACLPTASICVGEDRAQIRSIYYMLCL